MKKILYLNLFSVDEMFDFNKYDNYFSEFDKNIFLNRSVISSLFHTISYIDGVIKYCNSKINFDIMFEPIEKYLNYEHKFKSNFDNVYEFIQHKDILNIINNYNNNEDLLENFKNSEKEFNLFNILKKLFINCNYDIILIPVWMLNIKWVLITVLLNKLYGGSKIILGGPSIENSNNIRNLFKYYDCIISTDNIESVIYHIINDENLNIDEIGHEFDSNTKDYLPIYNDKHLNLIIDKSNMISITLTRNCKSKCKFCQAATLPFFKFSNDQIEQMLLYYKKLNLDIWFLDPSINYTIDIVSEIFKDYNKILYFFIELKNLLKLINNKKLKNIAAQTGLEQLQDINSISKNKFVNDEYSIVEEIIESEIIKSLNINIINKLPNNNKNSMLVTIEFLKKVKKNLNIDKLIFNNCIFYCLPGTEYYNNHDKYGLKFNYIEDFPKSFDNELIDILSKIPITYTNNNYIKGFDLLMKVYDDSMNSISFNNQTLLKRYNIPYTD